METIKETNLAIPAHVLLALQRVQRLYEDCARKFVPDDEYGQLSREAVAVVWKELAPIERPSFIARYIQWQENAPKPIFKDNVILNAYQMIEWARPEYDNNAKSLSGITAMSLDDLKDRAHAA